ncbi:MAG: hypothetical protein IJJ80_11540 [Clostridia bacterium]|nr:hypothetical protein [Clostridia bacterium]
MKKKSVIGLIIVSLCLLLALPAGMAETREGVIALEGMEETIQETLFESPQGFSFWYANEVLEAYPGERGNIDGVVVTSLYTDDAMVLSVIPEEDAIEYTRDFDESIAAQAADGRVQADIYREPENGRFYFLTVIAENGQYLSAVGDYSMEAAEGNGKYLQRVLDSVTFKSGYSIRPEWGTQAPDEPGRAQVVLTVLEPVTDVKLLKLDWNGTDVTWKQGAPLGSFSAQQTMSVTLEFIGEMPNNGIMYTDAAGVVHAFALDISGEDGQLYLWKLDE